MSSLLCAVEKSVKETSPAQYLKHPKISIARTGTHLPAFIKEKPVIWFGQLCLILPSGTRGKGEDGS